MTSLRHSLHPAFASVGQSPDWSPPALAPAGYGFEKAGFEQTGTAQDSPRPAAKIIPLFQPQQAQNLAQNLALNLAQNQVQHQAGQRLIPQTRWPHPPVPDHARQPVWPAQPSPDSRQPLAYAAPHPSGAAPASGHWPHQDTGAAFAPATRPPAQDQSAPLPAPNPVKGPVARAPSAPTPAATPVKGPAPRATPKGLRPLAFITGPLRSLRRPSRAAIRQMLPRALALVAACLLAFALLSPGPLPWALSADAAEPGSGGLSVEPMPFEQPGESFPGSAFYYLAPEPARQAASDQLAPDAHWDGSPSGNNFPGGDMAIGPAARPIAQIASQTDHMRALTCLTAAIYYEAATEPDAGQKAVAQVILNRMAHPAFPKTVCGVVYQGSERATGCQFTFTCDGSMARRPMAMFWNRAEGVARAALAGYVYAPIGLATHYHTFQVHPYWDDSVNFIGQIGAHRFYRMQGPAGAPNAFLATYRGGEPAPGPHPRSLLATTRPDVAADPLAVQRAFAAGKLAAMQGLSTAVYATHTSGSQPPAYASPAYTSEVLRRGGDAAYRANNLSGTHSDGANVKAEYQNSGRWLGDPQ